MNIRSVFLLFKQGQDTTTIAQWLIDSNIAVDAAKQFLEARARLLGALCTDAVAESYHAFSASVSNLIREIETHIASEEARLSQ